MFRRLLMMHLAAVLAVAAVCCFAASFDVPRVAAAGTPADMQSPTPGSTLAGSSVTFSWSAGTSAASYWLEVGRTQGGYELYGQSTGTTRSITVGGLPTDGRTVYVRLWTKFTDNSWLYSDYTYTSGPPPNAAATMTSPTPGSTLTGTAVTFQWSAGANVMQYYLEVATYQGGYNLYGQSTGTTRSASVSGVPADGTTIYVRLWTKFNDGSWGSNDYTYVAADRVAADMTSPTPGSTLGTSVTFTWSSGANVTQYYLEVATYQGGYNLYGKSTGTTRSVTVSGLPSDGQTVYVQLWTQFGDGSWVERQYTYAAASGTPAAMQSPTPGSTLAGPSVTFSWSAGTNASSYWLEVGRTQGGYEVYGQSTGTTRSVSVSGLPTDGRTVYVRLWTHFANNSWLYSDYTYVSGPPASVAAQITSPTAGSTLTDTSATFGWSAGGNADEYYLEVATYQGGYNLYGHSTGTSRSVTVNGLPTDGRTLYVRLWTRFTDGNWGSEDYTYTAADGVAAQIESPAPGSVLGSTATFTWSSGADADHYWFEVATYQGGYNIFGQSMGAARSTEVTGIPNGSLTIYVRLWTHLAAGWTYRDYTYTGPP